MCRLACLSGPRPPASDRAPGTSPPVVLARRLPLEGATFGLRTRAAGGGMAGGEAMMTELRLGPPGAMPEGEEMMWGEKMKKRAFPAVGWPPVCSYRRRRAAGDSGEKKKKKKYVKVSMDGAPFLRKLELDACEGYTGLAAAVDELFGAGGLAQNEYALIYEDKEGDWLLVGDVPWKMFTATCMRLRSMKKSDGKITASPACL